MTTRLAACAAIVIGAALTLRAAELAHRWSFNGDYGDSVGGTDAVKCGAYVSLYGNRVHMGYGGCTHGTGYVDLGTNMLDTAAATIEIWARHDGVKDWARVFDYGADDKHYFTLAWTGGTDFARDRAGAKNPGETATDDTMAPYELGVDYHISVTFRQQGDGSTFIRWQRRDAATGECQKFGTMTMPDGIQKIVDPVLYLGHSQYTADSDALAAYDEVRIWRGVLTDEQLDASAAAGPDAAIAVTDGAPQFAPAEPPEPPTQKAAVPNGGFRIMTYNVQFCYDDVSTIVPDRTAARIIAENPDFCCVNEIRDTNAHPEATILARLTGMHKSFGTNLILSKEAPVSSESFALPTSKAGWGTRYCMICEFADFCVAVTHLDVARESAGTAEVQASNAVSFAAIRERFANYTKPIFLCGDWNTRPYWDNMAVANEFLEILSPTNGVRTYHGHSATGGYILDYISVDKAHRDDFYVADSYVVEDVVTSDHNPVVAELYRRPAASALGWVDESFLTTGRTGTWLPSVAWNGRTWTAELGGENVFEANTPSGGNVVTMNVTASFDAVPEEESTPEDGVQGAVWLGTNGCFQVWTKELKVESGKLKVGDKTSWVDVEAEGVTPQTGVEYTFRVKFDYRYGTYSASVLHNSAYIPLVQSVNQSVNLSVRQSVNRTHFPLAAPAKSLSAVEFLGGGAFTSLLGEWAQKANGTRIQLR